MVNHPNRSAPRTFLVLCNPIAPQYSIFVGPHVMGRETLRTLGFRWDSKSNVGPDGRFVGEWQWQTAEGLSEEVAAASVLEMWNTLLAYGLSARGKIGGLLIRALLEKAK